MIVDRVPRVEGKVRGAIVGRMAELGYTDADMKKRLGVSDNTWRKYRNHPGEMSCAQLIIICDILKMKLEVNNAF